MKKILFSGLLIVVALLTYAQPVGYYNGTAALKGKELKTQLHEIIKGHVDFSYSQAKFIINYSDADPNNPSNVILFYTQRSQNANTYGTGENDINREHVWAKSHGTFAGIRPMDGDAFNLRPADGSVNVKRSNKDFGNVQPNGTRHEEASECWYSADKWEPGDATKGQAARIIFYMATRYEGTNGEMDLEVVNGFNTYPKPEHGDLATLLEWNRKFPPTDFERKRNERIFTVQQNRNPFIDNPEWADLIWADATSNPIQFDKFSITPQFPKAGGTAEIIFSVLTELQLDNIVISWGKSYNSISNQLTLDNRNKAQKVVLDLASFNEEELVHFTIEAASGTTKNTYRGTIDLPKNISSSSLTAISAIQGTGNASPMINQTVTFAGRVVANYDNTLYLQSGKNTYSGLCVYGGLETGHVGDSLVITGKVTEYNNLTEITDLSYVYNFRDNKKINPIVLTANQINEAYEGMLVTIRDVTFVNGGTEVPDANSSYVFSDNTGSSTVYFRYGSTMLNKKIPQGVTDVTGVVSQFQNTYQILPRNINDFSSGFDSIAPTITEVKVIDKSWITVDFNEKVEQVSAEKISNYQFSSGISILSIYLYPEGKTAIFNVEGLKSGKHSLRALNIKDLNGNSMEDSEIEFEASLTRKDEFTKSGLEIYPNPITNGILQIRSEKKVSSVQLFNTNGKLVNALFPESNEVSLNINSSPGIYFLRIIMDDSSTMSTKVIVQ